MTQRRGSTHLTLYSSARRKAKRECHQQDETDRDSSRDHKTADQPENDAQQDADCALHIIRF